MAMQAVQERGAARAALAAASSMRSQRMLAMQGSGAQSDNIFAEIGAAQPVTFGGARAAGRPQQR